MNAQWRPVVVGAWLIAGLSAAESRIHLKTRQLAEIDDLTEHLAAPPSRRHSGRSHVLVQFRRAPAPAQFKELERRGASVVHYVPDLGFLLSVEDGARFDGLGLRWVGRLRSSEKLSPLLEEAAGRTAAVVEFFPDVSAEDARALLGEHLVEVHGHPALRPNEFLVTGSADRIARLTEWDEVSYVYPASQELLDGRPVQACAGALTVYGPVGQYVARVGEGWDGAGRNPVQLRYALSGLAGSLPRTQAEAEIVRALDEWARHVAITFTPSEDGLAPRTLRLLFATGDHGDPFPFDGRGRVLAHAFYPAPLNPEPLAGDVHFDDQEQWSVGAYVDLFTVALHEVGHALGLGHSDKPGAVMYPYYRRATALTPDDIEAIREMYAPRDGSTPAHPASPPEPPARPNPPVTPTPAPAPKPDAPSKPAADTVAPSLAIVSPAATTLLTSSPSIVIRGTATDNVGVVEVTWSSTAGTSGVAQGTAHWVTGAIPLNQGANTITIRARDAAGNVAWRSLVVTRR